MRPAPRERLADYTTLGLGGPARAFVSATTEDELIEAVQAAADEPVLILGGGSNLVVADEGFPGTVIHVATRGFNVDGNTVTVAAGEHWDSVVERTIAAGLSGLECLSGIPGLAGATPIQNVGAYGQEVSETITGVRVFDRQKSKRIFYHNGTCNFAYRTSIFRGADRYVVLDVAFELDTAPKPIRYAELAAAAGDDASPAGIREAVLGLRRRKGMVIDPADPDSRSAGSFFTNPIVDPALVPTAAPRFDAGDGLVKVPAAWLIEQAGFGKGYPGPDGTRISTKHTLALVNAGGATTAGLLKLAREIRDGVHATFGITLHPEPLLVGVTLLPSAPGHAGARPAWALAVTDSPGREAPPGPPRPGDAKLAYARRGAGIAAPSGQQPPRHSLRSPLSALPRSPLCLVPRSASFPALPRSPLSALPRSAISNPDISPDRRNVGFTKRVDLGFGVVLCTIVHRIYPEAQTPRKTFRIFRV